MSSIAVNGAELAYDEAGAGPPLVLVHAGICDRRMWDEVVPMLATDHRVIRYDMRGFGDSPAPDGEYANWRDLAAVLEALDAVPATVIGVSNGGATALWTAVRRGELVDRLVLVAPGFPGWQFAEEVRAAWEAEEAAWEAGELDLVVELNLRLWVDGRLRSADQTDPEFRSRVAVMQRRALEIDNAAAVHEAGEPLTDDDLRRLAVPTLVVVGEGDLPDMLEIGRHLAAQLPDGRLVTMPDVAHLPPIEQPERFVEIVRDFLG